METMKSAEELYRFASRYLPGGVCASARSNPAIGHPFFVSRGEGPYVYDLDGRQYVDMCTSHGASLLGHNHPAIRAAVSRALELGIICAYETEHHAALAQRLCELVPCAEMARFAGSGTETVMHGLRLARAATGRERIVKFEGHFHGYSDHLYYSSAPPLAQAGPADSPRPYPQSAGMPRALADLITIVPFNDPDALAAAFARHGHEIATLILEPINYDSGCILPRPGFIELCRALCDRYAALLFFDEVLTAFRVGLAGAQGCFGVTPDLAVLGKAFGGGMPISALVGKRSIMAHLRPEGASEHSGTYLAHLTTVLAARAALDEYAQPGFYDRLAGLGGRFYAGFQEIIRRSGVPCRLQYAGPRFGLYFGVDEPVWNYRQAAAQNEEMLLAFIAGCIRRGVYFHVSAHHGFSAAHTGADLDRALEAIEGGMADVRDQFM
jgi:glutamate-1-semialdehyde 2,1-aminomutase